MNRFLRVAFSLGILATFGSVSEGQVVQRALIKPRAPVGPFEDLGRSVTCAEGRVILGVAQEDGSATQVNGVEDENAEDAGAVHLYERGALNWQR